MVRLTDKEAAAIVAVLAEIRKEDARIKKRSNRIKNLCGNILVLIRKAQRREKEYPSLFD